MSDKPQDTPQGSDYAAQPDRSTDPKGMNPPPAPPRSTEVEPPVVAVTFTEPCLSYNVGETAAFTPDVAKQLVEDGVADGGKASDRRHPQQEHPTPPAPATKAGG